MKTLGEFYSMRDAAKIIGNTDSRTVQMEIVRNGIPTGKTKNATVIDKAGLARLQSIYNAKRSGSVTARSA